MAQEGTFGSVTYLWVTTKVWTGAATAAKGVGVARKTRRDRICCLRASVWPKAFVGVLCIEPIP